jgi:glutamyl-tRNA synthetase
MPTSDIDEKIRKAAILNAIKHDGKADPGAVLGNLLGENIDLKLKAKELMPSVRRVVQEVNSITLGLLNREASEKWPEQLVKEKTEEERKLPPLPNAHKYSTIVTRVAPNPDFVLHIGNARAAILSHDYARMYNGKFIVRFEDTDPRLKKAQLQYYDIIREDLKWLDCGWDEEYIQSDRLPKYYEVGRTLISKGAAYVCECQPERWRELVSSKTACPDREMGIAKQVERWEKMLNGGFGEGQAVYRVKTDLNNPNPAVRDWPGFRIVDTIKNPHPRVGSKFRVWPLYNMASGVDDHELGITHVIRGKEHLTNMARQLFMYQHLGWHYPDAVHFGRLKVEGMNLSKSKMMRALDEGEYQGVDDPRLGTLAALRRRGYRAETIRQLMWDVGPKPVDVTISWDNINAMNRKIIDPTSHRYYLAPDPIRTIVSGVRESKDIHAPLHPQHPEMGSRTLRLQSHNGASTLLLAGSDRTLLVSGNVVRLMGLFNMRPVGFSDSELNGECLGESVTKSENVPILQWVPDEQKLPVTVVMPDATQSNGFAEEGLSAESVGSIIQFVRFGFGRIDEINGDKMTVYFAHE